VGSILPCFMRSSESAEWIGAELLESGDSEGLRGEEIPICGRLMAVADVYDALISRRVYKPPFSHDKAVEIIAEGKETHFDPDVVEAFLLIQAEFKRIALEFADLEED